MAGYSASRPATDRGDHPLHPAFIAKNEAASAWMVDAEAGFGGKWLVIPLRDRQPIAAIAPRSAIGAR
jgi:hypothetical protein